MAALFKHLRAAGAWCVSIAFALCAACALGAPATAYGDIAGHFEITGGTKGIDWTYEKYTLTVLQGSKPLTIGMAEPGKATGSGRIAVAPGPKAVDLTLHGINISAGASSFLPFEMAGATVRLTIDGENIISAHNPFCGIHAPKGSTLSVTAKNGNSDRLVIGVSGDDTDKGGACIGGGDREDGGDITVNSGTIVLQSLQGAGVGGGYDASGGSFTLNGGDFNATGGRFAAGVGGSHHGGGGRITINGSKNVGVLSVQGAPGLGGGGLSTDMGTISITGGSNIGSIGSDAPAIGAGATEGTVTGSISITGGALQALALSPSGGDYPAMGCNRGLQGGKISISGGSISARAKGSTDAFSASAISITGGDFGKGQVSGDPLDPNERGMAYNVVPDPGYIAVENADAATKKDRPISVYHVTPFDVSAEQKQSACYTGDTFDQTCIKLTPAGDLVPTDAELASHAIFFHHSGSAAGGELSEAKWKQGLPTNADIYTVKVHVSAIRHDGQRELLALSGPAVCMLTIDPVTLDVSGFSVEDKVYDGTTDATPNGELAISGLVEGEQLEEGTDYLVGRAAFEDAHAGTKKIATAEMKLVADGPVARNYRLASDHVTGAADIARKSIQLCSAVVDSKDYDGTTDTVFRTAEFHGMLMGAELAAGKDYTATAAFRDAAPGEAKPVDVAVTLVTDGPTARDYVLAEGHASIVATADIRNAAGRGSRADGDCGGLAATGDGALSRAVVALALGIGAIGAVRLPARRC